MTAKFYDHASNLSPANGSATARVRREVIATGQAYRVDATPRSGGSRFYWNGGQYDALRLARELVFNRYQNVTMTAPDGVVMNAEKIQAGGY